MRAIEPSDIAPGGGGGVAFMGAGRKRKIGARGRTGRLKQKPKSERVEERVRLARSQPHRRGLKSQDKLSELAESPLGRLTLKGVLTAGERAAGETFAAIVNKYRTVIEGPKPVRSLSIATSAEPGDSADQEAAEKFSCPSQYADPIGRQVTIGGKLITVREWPCQVAGASCACADRRQRYARAYEAIAGAGRRALMAVIAVAVRNEEIPATEIVYLKAGLSAARRHLGLTHLDD